MEKNVFCFGTFDILHKGHREFFRDIKKQGEMVIVIVVSDKIVCDNKGEFPKNNQKQRMVNLKKLGVVNKVFPTNGLKETYDLVTKNAHCIFAFGYDQNTPVVDKLKNMLKKKNIKFYISGEFAEGIHSSKLK